VKRSYSSKRETFGLALSNLFVGGFGGLPATAALSRTALNVRSGAYNRVATFMGTIILGAVSMSALGYFIYIPASTIASILVVNAYKMINFKEIARIYRADKKSAFAILFTAYASLTLDTFSGLLVGTLSLFMIHFDSFGKLKCTTDETSDKRKLIVRIECPIVFVNISELERYLQTLVIELSLANNDNAEAALDLCPGSPAAGIRALSETKASFAAQADAGLTQPPPPPASLRRMQLDLAGCIGIDFDGMDLLARSVETIRGMGLFADVSIVNQDHLGPEVGEVLAHGPIRHGR
jgi:MFS superfamily sulfate permease-like transporter